MSDVKKDPELREEIMALPVFDTHNHLKGGEDLSARDFWTIGHYFWFKRELQAAGYPRNADALPEDARAKAFIGALDKARNTAWNQAVRRSMVELFGIELKDVASIAALNRRIAETHADANWPKTVCDRAGLAALTIGGLEKQPFGRIAERVLPVPNFNPFDAKSVQRFLAAGDRKAAIGEAVAEVRGRLDAFKAQGIKTLRVPWTFRKGTGLITDVPELTATGNTEDRIQHYLAHALFEELDKRRFHLQIFLGVEQPTPGYKQRSDAQRTYPRNDTDRVVEMHDIFNRYSDCTFELINAAELSSLDLVQAARIFTNVYPGGLWWFAFRPSIYRLNMQYRMEGLPACRATFVATDARCIEWAYIKTMLVKRLMAEFFEDQIARGWIDRETALATARSWLHDTAAGLYL